MLHGKLQVNEFTLLEYTINNVNNTHVEPVVYEVVAEGLDTKHYPFRYEFQMLGGNDELNLLIQLLEEVRERREWNINRNP